MSNFVRNLLLEQRKRMIGTLMTHMENKVYPRLNPAERKELRDKVLSATQPYHDTCLDMLKASVDDGAVINEEAVRVMADLNSEVRGLRKELRHGH